MKRAAKRAALMVLAAMVPLAGAEGASAETAASAITAHNGVTVELSQDAGKCGVRSKEEFAKQLDGALGEIGLRVDPSQPVVARLTVSAKPVESIQGQCVIFVGLAFVIPLEVDFITVTEKAADRKAMVAVLEKARRFPIVLYEDSDFTAAWPTNAHGQALYLVDQLTQRFAGQR
jgi:hypothetical protein